MGKENKILSGIFFFYLLLILAMGNQIISQVQNTREIIQVSFCAVGDLMVHGSQLKYAKVDDSTYNFHPVFSEVKPFIESFDFAMGNLETVFAGNKMSYKGYPVFNTPDSFLDALKECGFDLLFTANNHVFDQGVNGLKRTIQKINESGLYFSGTNLTAEDLDSIKIIDIKGIKTAILSYTYSTNNGLANSHYLNRMNEERIKSDLETADTNGSELNIVYYHFGQEYEREPNEYQLNIVDSTFAWGADVILASHTHSIQPVKIYKINNNLKKSFAVFSMGNFVSNQRWRYSDAGIILGFTVVKNLHDNSIELKKINYLPTWVYKGDTGKAKQFKIFPAEISYSSEVPSYFSEEDVRLMKESFWDTKEIITKYTDEIKLTRINKKFNINLADLQKFPSMKIEKIKRD
jgi:poly-gamma-glutamate synthesis protein (capsule biosynthesis protein)